MLDHSNSIFPSENEDYSNLVLQLLVSILADNPSLAPRFLRGFHVSAGHQEFINEAFVLLPQYYSTFANKSQEELRAIINNEGADNLNPLNSTLKNNSSNRDLLNERNAAAIFDDLRRLSKIYFSSEQIQNLLNQTDRLDMEDYFDGNPAILLSFLKNNPTIKKLAISEIKHEIDVSLLIALLQTNKTIDSLELSEVTVALNNHPNNSNTLAASTPENNARENIKALADAISKNTTLKSLALYCYLGKSRIKAEDANILLEAALIKNKNLEYFSINLETLTIMHLDILKSIDDQKPIKINLCFEKIEEIAVFSVLADLLEQKKNLALTLNTPDIFKSVLILRDSDNECASSPFCLREETDYEVVKRGEAIALFKAKAKHLYFLSKDPSVNEKELLEKAVYDGLLFWEDEENGEIMGLAMLYADPNIGSHQHFNFSADLTCSNNNNSFTFLSSPTWQQQTASLITCPQALFSGPPLLNNKRGISEIEEPDSSVKPVKVAKSSVSNS